MDGGFLTMVTQSKFLDSKLFVEANAGVMVRTWVPGLRFKAYESPTYPYNKIWCRFQGVIWTIKTQRGRRGSVQTLVALVVFE